MLVIRTNNFNFGKQSFFLCMLIARKGSRFVKVLFNYFYNSYLINNRHNYEKIENSKF